MNDIKYAVMVIYFQHKNRLIELQRNNNLFITNMLHKVAFGSNKNCSNWMYILHLLRTYSQIAAQSSFFAFNLLYSTKIYSFTIKTWPQCLHYLSLAFCCTPHEKIARVSLGDLGGHWDDQRRPIHIGNFLSRKATMLLLNWGLTLPAATLHF